MTPPSAIDADILNAVPHLRVIALSLVADTDYADDLVQETVAKALANLDQFTPATNMRAQPFTIRRNEFYTLHRKRRREVQDPDGILASSRLATVPAQDRHLELENLKAALLLLPVEQREAVLLVAGGISYEEVAEICGTAVGMIKSRVNRGRKGLAELLGIVDPEDMGADRVMKAALPPG